MRYCSFFLNMLMKRDRKRVLSEARVGIASPIVLRLNFGFMQMNVLG